MTLDKFWEYIDNIKLRQYMIVSVRTKSKNEKEWEYSNELLVLDEQADYIWFDDWYMGYNEIEILGCIPVESVKVPQFKEKAVIK